MKVLRTFAFLLVAMSLVLAACAPAATEAPVEATEAPVEAGQSGEVVIEYNADRRGDFKKKITVFFNKQRKAETLWIRGTVE